MCQNLKFQHCGTALKERHCVFANPNIRTGTRPKNKAPFHPTSLPPWKPILKFFSSPLSFFFGNRTTVHSCTTPGSMTMIVMMWVTAVTTAPTIVTQTKQTQTTTEREMPVLWTSMEMVRTGNFNKNYPCKIYIFMSVRSCFLSIYFVFIIFSSFHRHTEWEGQLPLCVQCWPERYRPGRSGRHVWQLPSGT